VANERVLVIVESPAKAKTIAGYLNRQGGRTFDVEASVGHVRDLASKASELPESLRKEPWAKYAVDTEADFTPYYVVHANKKQTIAELKRKLKNADELLLATDEDREGEAIAWHLLEVLKPKVPVRRMVFHEITEHAITDALDQTRELNMKLVDAQETRRIVDRLYGYPVSEVLWKKIGRDARSAGRVQSVAVRLVVDRERERIAFVSSSYWDVEATFDPGAFSARLVAIDGKRLASGKDFDDRGQLTAKDSVVLDDRSGLHRPIGGREAGQALTLRSLHDLDPAAGGVAPIPMERPTHDARGPGALRARLHHLYAYRLDVAVRAGGVRRAIAGRAALWPGPCGRRAAPVRPQGQERAGGSRGHPPCWRCVSHAG
jgi:DNA topoisomerase-1